jgi:hypothetical protein
MTTITLSRVVKMELIKAIQEKEAKGWECLHPIRETKNESYTEQTTFRRYTVKMGK